MSLMIVASIPLTTVEINPSSSRAIKPATVVPPGEETLSIKVHGFSALKNHRCTP